MRALSTRSNHGADSLEPRGQAAREYELASRGPVAELGKQALCRVAKQHCDLGWQAYARREGLIWSRDVVPAPPPPPAKAKGRKRGAKDVASAEEEADEGLRYALRALKLARRCAALAPELSTAHLAVAAALGRLALYSDTRTKVQMSDEVLHTAERIVAADPGDDYGWHSLGRWHYEMSRLNLAAKLVIKLYYQGSAFNASMDVATRAYERAVELAPGRLVHRVELAKCYEAQGERTKALEQLEAATGCDVEDMNAVNVLTAGLQQQERLKKAQSLRVRAGDDGDGARRGVIGIGAVAAAGALRQVRSAPRRLLRQPAKLKRAAGRALRRRREANGERAWTPLKRPKKLVGRLLRLPDKSVRKAVKRVRGGSSAAAAA